jgi:hypothetical protein
MSFIEGMTDSDIEAIIDHRTEQIPKQLYWARRRDVHKKNCKYEGTNIARRGI